MKKYEDEKTSAFIAAILMAGTVNCYGGTLYQNVSAYNDDYTECLSGYTFRYSNREGRYLIEGKNFCEWFELDEVRADTAVDNFVVPSTCHNSIYENGPSENQIFEVKYESVNCEGAENVCFSEGIYEIDDDALNYNGALKSVSFPDSVKKIGKFSGPSKLIYRAHSGTYAEKFSEDNGYEFEYLGDIDNDKKITCSDLMKLSAYLSGKSELEKEEKLRADDNLDAKVDIVDLLKLKNQIIEPRASALGASLEGAIAVPETLPAKSDDEINPDGFIDFAVKTAPAVLLDTKDENGEENTVYSPLSVFAALSMAAECADGNTLDEIIEVLSVDDVKDMREENLMLMSSFFKNDYIAYCKIANSLWINEKFSFYPDTLKDIASNYYAPVFPKNFCDKASGDEISAWISKNTGGKINPESEVDPDEIMRIINTVCFKEKWIKEFNDAQPDTFYLKNGDEITADFLKFLTNFPTEKIGFADDFMKYSLEMEDGYKMTFVLPDEGVSIDDIVSDSSKLRTVYSDNVEYQKRKIVFSVPKFDVASKFDLIETAEKLGIEEAFDPYKGNFTKAVDYEASSIGSAYVSQFDHEAAVMIDERGCEAASYTVIRMSAGCAGPSNEEPVYFELNRPFFYYITNETGAPVFSGIINDPTLK